MRDVNAAISEAESDSRRAARSVISSGAAGPDLDPGALVEELDPVRCYQVVLARDRRFDGRLFSGVVTTGVYCRPICPVSPPKAENIRWFRCAAGAEAAGFRPC